MNVRELTKKLISLQSFDDGRLYEKPMSDFLVAYVEKNLPWLSIDLQEVEPNRFNVYLRDSSPTKLLVVDQIDTVVPEQGWDGEALLPVESDGRIYGLGSSDSKGNVAAFLKALERFGETKGLAILLYVDEEYCFKGMKYFISSSLAKNIQPEFVLSIDGNGSVLGSGCRGLVEFDIQIRSESGHTANPKTPGALLPYLTVFQKFQTWLKQYSDLEQGEATAQIANLRSGLIVNESDEGFVFGKEGNRLPNFTEAKIEIRTTPTLSWKEIESFWKSELGRYADLDASLTGIFDLDGFSTPRERLKLLEQSVFDSIGSVSYLDPSTFGYLDVAMLKTVFPDASLCSFGIGEPGVNHKPNEYVRIDRLDEGVSVYLQILKKLLT
ncbi:MAG: M20 family metallopeptidase [Parcubacteria group bacterium]|nr:M20 family metallopeptidase [Parcubacteria group bacterium]